jgi:UDP-N-acetylmuramoyl-L-alanyl-D-glutamate--2,6-diaminopimelate ligase
MQKTAGRIRVSLREFFPDSRIFGSRDIHVSSCSAAAERCRDGDLFVALDTADSDGHALVDEAVRRGAQAVLAERCLPVDVPVCVVSDSREAYGRLCQQLAGDPSRQMRTVGVTGTNGKTITSWLIAAIFRAAGQRTGLLSSIAHHDGQKQLVASQTTPAPQYLADWMSRMREHGCVNSVLELSSRALAERRTAGVQFDVGVLTNVRRDHLDYHGSLQNYRRAKSLLFGQLKPDGVAVVNADDPASKFLLPHIDRPVLTVGMHLPAELNATVIERYAGQQTFLLTAGNETVAVQTQMIGDHHVHNCLSAAAVGLLAGLDLTTVARGLEAVGSIPGRMEAIVCGQPFGVYVDRARTPDTLAVTLRALRSVTTGRVICVFGAGGGGDGSLRPLLGRVVERGADVGVITNDNPRHEQPLQIAHDIIDGYARPARSHILPDRAEAIRWALSEARPGDAVLIAGKGDRRYQIVGSHRQFFDDCEVARQWLQEVGSEIEYPEQLAERIVPFTRSSHSVN